MDGQAGRAFDVEREDLTRLVLERKNANLIQIQYLDEQIGEIKEEEHKMEEAETRMSTKVEEFKSRKEIIKAQYSATEPQVRIKASITGITEEMADVGVFSDPAMEKMVEIRAKSLALDDMINSGVLTDYISNKDEIERELKKIAVHGSVEEELAKLKSEKERKKNQQLEQEGQQ